MKRKVVLFLFVLIAILTIRIFCGVYEHDEFCDDAFFIKHRPTWKWRFHSPMGMSDLKMEDLTEEQQIEQKYFDEFVKNQGLSS